MDGWTDGWKKGRKERKNTKEGRKNEEGKGRIEIVGYNVYYGLVRQLYVSWKTHLNYITAGILSSQTHYDCVGNWD